MAAYVGNPDLLIDALLDFAQEQPDPGGYLRNLRNTALAAMVGNGDEYATRVHNEGGGSEWMREIPPNIMAQLAAAALKRLATLATGGPTGGLRGGDFSQRPTTLG